MKRFVFGTRKNFFLVAAALSMALGGLTLATPAVAKAPLMTTVEKSSTSNRHISYADLNLASTSGEAALKRRVGNAVESLCEGVSSDEGAYWSDDATIRCRASAWEQ